MTTGGWIGVVAAVLGGALAAFGAAIGFHQRRLERRGRQVPGTIVDVVLTRRVNDKTQLYRPVFEFTAVDGTRVRRQSNVASSPPTHAIGDAVVVWHDPADPQRSDIVGESRGMAPLMVLLGLIFAAAGIGVVVLSRMQG
jgi:hypothetical protein